MIRFVLDDADVAGIEQLRAGFRSLYKIDTGDGYAGVAGLHGVPGWYSWNHQMNSRSSGNYRLYLPWYRAFLAKFERAARANVPGFSLRCWDWTKGGIPLSFNEVTLRDGQANPLAGYRINLPNATPPIVRPTTRSPGPLDMLPTMDDVSSALSRTDWADFSDALEGLGDQMRGWVSGDSAVAGTEAYDPIFYVLHCNVDRLWAIWQKMHEPVDSPGAIDPELLDMVLAPFGITVRDVLDTRRLGYAYE